MSKDLMTRRTLLARAAGAAAAAAITPQGLLHAEPPDAGEGLGQVRAWDAHVHLSGVSGTVPERVAALLKFADRLGIERIVLSMGTRWTSHPTPDDFRQQNDDVLRAIACEPQRVMGLVYVNPRFEPESLAELDRCVRDGPMVGVKLWIAMVCSRPELDPIARRAGELRVPVLQHCYWRTEANLPDESNPADLAELAGRHPQVSFICAHTGNDWERGIRAIRAAKNVWAEICGSDPTAGMVEMAVRELGPQRVLYGSDAGGRSFASQLAKVYGAEIPLEAKKLILRENLKRLLDPVLEAKRRNP